MENHTPGSGTSPTSAELDAADPLAAQRAAFYSPDEGELAAYLDGNSLGRPLKATASNLASFVQDAWGSRLIRGWDEQWMDEPTVVGDRIGEVTLGAAAGQVTVGDSTSVMLYKLIRAAVDAQPGRDEIVVDRDNFPTDRFIIEGIAAEKGASIVWVSANPASGVRTGDLEGLVGERTAVVVLSHVAYRSGFLADARAITAMVKDAGALMLWDLCHSVGSVPLELDEWGVDLAVGCTYKYLNGGPGSPAFAYVNASQQGRLRQPIWGWMGADNPFGMTESYKPATGIRSFITGTPPVLAMQPLKDMVELIASVGMEAVREKSIRLTEHAISLADELLVPLGVEIASPRDPAERGSHITVDHPLFGQVTTVLWERGVIPDFRPPHGLRIGLSPLSTGYGELELGMTAIRDALAELL
ncbi:MULTISPECIES: kynureninase [Arthrobacter]|uniref:Kynureninase n=1 Tax=Arthrobacter terricola TaxID=2547396 RepID=A0A4R5KVE2_9MICC|nr:MULTISPECIES: aminotransferase class V-fold PLP-dependent enzyme [Arthrobacter]MBT8160388.1 aminotransferase class V-fold PLP-dependent enzyme [Arthrobacter sp. GN70]TDF99923.1 aminotransferase class V-fold PLP-dependent enzyme [Arthrobacter terricola]